MVGLPDLLDGGDVNVLGRLPRSSNFTFLIELRNGDTSARVVYKPEQGEQELWDFPHGEIYKREVAAYELSRALGWPAIPETIVGDGPYGVGSMQRFQPADFEQNYFTLFENAETHPTFLEIATFDVIANNADRKAGHCLLGEDGVIYAIDNGLCFNTEPKLRTVIWEFEGDHIPEYLLTDLERVASALPAEVTDLLEKDEIQALSGRLTNFLIDPSLPSLVSQRQYPYPLI